METTSDPTLTRALVDSGAPALASRRPDPLRDAEAATEWLGALAQVWAEERDLPSPTIALVDADLPHLRDLRHDLRSRVAELVVTVSISLSPERVSPAPSGDGVAWITAAVATEALESRPGHGVYRMKVCRNPQCGMSFIDHSKNNSRVWHDAATCGNSAHVNAFRSRAKAEGSGAVADR